jgi:hypothetical protein
LNLLLVFSFFFSRFYFYLNEKELSIDLFDIDLLLEFDFLEVWTLELLESALPNVDFLMALLRELTELESLEILEDLLEWL